MGINKFVRKKLVEIDGQQVEIRRLPLAAGLKLVGILASKLTETNIALLQSGDLGAIRDVLSAIPELGELLILHGVTGDGKDWLAADWNLGAELLMHILDFNTEQEAVIDPLMRAAAKALPILFEKPNPETNA